MNPDPNDVRSFHLRGGDLPKKDLKNSLGILGLTGTIEVVEIFTTTGSSFSATSAKVVGTFAETGALTLLEAGAISTRSSFFSPRINHKTARTASAVSAIHRVEFFFSISITSDNLPTRAKFEFSDDFRLLLNEADFQIGKDVL
jgi:hypothetical protein